MSTINVKRLPLFIVALVIASCTPVDVNVDPTYTSIEVTDEVETLRLSAPIICEARLIHEDIYFVWSYMEATHVFEVTNTLKGEVSQYFGVTHKIPFEYLAKPGWLEEFYDSNVIEENRTYLLFLNEYNGVKVGFPCSVTGQPEGTCPMFNAFTLVDDTIGMIKID
ncbi:MAG: hypothetical protein AAFX87_28475 [Bacteroidota bacterium]